MGGGWSPFEKTQVVAGWIGFSNSGVSWGVPSRWRGPNPLFRLCLSRPGRVPRSRPGCGGACVRWSVDLPAPPGGRQLPRGAGPRCGGPRCLQRSRGAGENLWGGPLFPRMKSGPGAPSLWQKAAAWRGAPRTASATLQRSGGGALCPRPAGKRRSGGGFLGGNPQTTRWWSWIK